MGGDDWEEFKYKGEGSNVEKMESTETKRREQGGKVKESRRQEEIQGVGPLSFLLCNRILVPKPKWTGKFWGVFLVSKVIIFRSYLF